MSSLALTAIPALAGADVGVDAGHGGAPASVTTRPPAEAAGHAVREVVTGGCGGEGALLGCLLQGTAVGRWFAERHVTVSGWTAASYTGASRTTSLLPFGFNDQGNRFLLQQNWLRIDRAVDDLTGALRLGFRSDWLVPGSDYRFNVARGLFDGQLTRRDGGPLRYGIDPAQFYGELLLTGVGRGLNLRLGRFFAPFGVENVASIDTPLASRAYTFIYDPFTQTGLLARLDLEAGWSVKAGIVTGNDIFIGEAASPYFVGGFGWAPANAPSSLAFTAILGSGRFDVGEQFHNPQVFDLVHTRRLGPATVWTLNTLYGFTRGAPGPGFADWYGVVNYLTHTLGERSSATFRLEFFDDDDGQRTGRAGLYSAVTVGLGHAPARWLVLRPEVRVDHHDGAAFGDDRALVTGTLEAIVRW